MRRHEQNQPLRQKSKVVIADRIFGTKENRTFLKGEEIGAAFKPLPTPADCHKLVKLYADPVRKRIRLLTGGQHDEKEKAWMK